MYILQCSNGTFYTGSTRYLERRVLQHQNGIGANYTRKHGPVILLYYEAFTRIDWAFYREKQVQRWSQSKKKALMRGDFLELHNMAICKNESFYGNQ